MNAVKSISRKAFLKNTAVLCAGAALATSFKYLPKTPKLSFSTLGCPDWSFLRIADFAVEHGYKGIEVRGLQREMDLPQSKEFNTPERRNATLSLMRDKDLKFVGLGSSATLHFADAAIRERNLDEGKRFIDLAEDINCPYVRVFPNNFPEGQEKSKTIDLISAGLLELAEYANGSSVSVLMETHGDLVQTDDLISIMEATRHKHAGLLWDVCNMWVVTQEPPVRVYSKLRKYIRHTHIKDAILNNEKPEYKFLGEGIVPIFDAIRELIKDDYNGFYSFEWEKLWHPQLAEPDLAIANYANTMRKHF